MNAFYLHKPDGTRTEVSACGGCGLVAAAGNYDISERCCTCYHCGQPLSDDDKKARRQGHSECDQGARAQRGIERLEKATLVPEYDGPVYFEGGHGSLGDDYFATPDELAEYLDDYCEDDSSRPEFAFCCTSRPIALSVDDIIYSATEEAYEDASGDLSGVDELREAVRLFNEANKALLTWDMDPKFKAAIPARAMSYADRVDR